MAIGADEKQAKTEARTAIYAAITKEVTFLTSDAQTQVDVSACLLRLAEAYAHVAGAGVDTGPPPARKGATGKNSRDW